MKVLPSKEFEDLIYEESLSKGMSPEEAGLRSKSLRGQYTRSTGEIVIRKGAGTRTKLHELGHKEVGVFQTLPGKPSDWPETTWGDTVYNEIMANKYAWEHQGRKLTHRVAVPAVFALISEEGATPKEAVDTTVAVMRDYIGIPVSSGGKAELLRWAKGSYRRVSK